MKVLKALSILLLALVLLIGLAACNKTSETDFTENTITTPTTAAPTTETSQTTTESESTSTAAPTTTVLTTAPTTEPTNTAPTTAAPTAEASQTTTESAPTATSAPTTTASTTVPATTPTTATVPTEPTEPRKTVYYIDCFTTYFSMAEYDDWEYAVNLFRQKRTGKQYISLYSIPCFDNIEGIIGFADAYKNVWSINDLAMQVRMNKEGFFDAKNGDGFGRIAEVDYEANVKYLVEIFVDLNSKTYSVYITPDGGEKALIAENFAFSTTSGGFAYLGQAFFISDQSDSFIADTLNVLEVYDPLKTYYSTGENMGWQDQGIYLGREYNGKVKISWDMTVLIDEAQTIVAFTDKEFPVFGFGDLAMLVRTNLGTAFFDVRNGEKFEKLAEVPVVKNDKYHIELIADMDAKTYSVWVTPSGEASIRIAKEFSFRTTADKADGAAKVYLTSAHENDSMKMENLVIEELND